MVKKSHGWTQFEIAGRAAYRVNHRSRYILVAFSQRAYNIPRKIAHNLQVFRQQEQQLVSYKHLFGVKAAALR